MNRIELGKQIYNVAYITGEFLLRSGTISNEYFDKYQFESRPDILRYIARYMSEFLGDKYDLLGALEMGGIPIATAISLITGDKTVFIRKEAKKYGTAKLAEGDDVNGKTIILIEDVVTSGGQIIISAEELRNMGANIEKAICVIDRESGGKEKLAEAGIELVSLFKMSELKKWNLE